MEFKIENNLLKEKLELMNGAIPQKSSQVSLVNLNLKIANGKIVMIGSNGNMSIKQVVVNEDLIEIVEEGQALINYTMLKAIINKIQGDMTHFHIDNDKLIIKNKKSRYTLNLQDYNTYPKVEFKPYENKIELSKDNLVEIIEQVSYATSQNEKRPILIGVNLKIKDNELIASATDSFRLAMYKYKLSNMEDLNVTIPKDALVYINKLVSKTKLDKITIYYDNYNLLFQVDNLLFKTSLLEGNYPELKKAIMANTYDNDIIVEKQILLDALDRVLTLAYVDKEKKLSIIQLKISQYNKLITINSTNDEIGAAKEEIEIQNKPYNDLLIDFGANYLIDCLKALNGEIVKIKFAGDTKPFIVISEDDIEENKLHLILPVRTNR